MHIRRPGNNDEAFGRMSLHRMGRRHEGTHAEAGSLRHTGVAEGQSGTGHINGVFLKRSILNNRLQHYHIANFKSIHLRDSPRALAALRKEAGRHCRVTRHFMTTRTFGAWPLFVFVSQCVTLFLLHIRSNNIMNKLDMAI